MLVVFQKKKTIACRKSRMLYKFCCCYLTTFLCKIIIALMPNDKTKQQIMSKSFIPQNNDLIAVRMEVSNIPSWLMKKDQKWKEEKMKDNQTEIANICTCAWDEGGCFPYVSIRTSPSRNENENHFGRSDIFCNSLKPANYHLIAGWRGKG